ncbi:MAG TPA: hypothetical protein VHO03_08365 [Ignavibacteriales bacterium]|nr:hypothetical protein [Ignavibacteriales bacterium]
MKDKITRSLLLFLAGISIGMQFQGCYTLIKYPERTYSGDINSSYAQASDSCVVEGMVHYFGAWSTREESRPSGYMLENIFWLRNAPPINFRYVSIDSKIGEAHLNKYVRIKGRFLTPFSDSYYSSETLSVSIKVSEIEIIK